MSARASKHPQTAAAARTHETSKPLRRSVRSSVSKATYTRAWPMWLQRRQGDAEGDTCVDMRDLWRRAAAEGAAAVSVALALEAVCEVPDAEAVAAGGTAYGQLLLAVAGRGVQLLVAGAAAALR